MGCAPNDGNGWDGNGWKVLGTPLSPEWERENTTWWGWHVAGRVRWWRGWLADMIEHLADWIRV